MWGGAKTIVRVQKISPKKNNNRANKAAINNSPLRRLSGAVKNVLDSAQNLDCKDDLHIVTMITYHLDLSGSGMAAVEHVG